ncbi:MAG: peptide ABC transporter permease, partial [Paludibacterium sp.]|nr:peptide ABC transporter permease [Paludibacterium sp.]
MFSKAKRQEMAQNLGGTLEAAVVEGRSPWKDARIRFKRNRAAVISLVLLALIGLLVVVGPWLLPNTFDDQDWSAGQPYGPTMAGWHLFGTDDQMRDLLVRVLMGGRITFLVGIVGSFVAVVIGVSWGAIAGFMGGKVDALMMRFVDVMYALP